MLLFRDTLLAINNADVWVDNLYLRVSQLESRPDLAFVTIGPGVGTERSPYEESHAIHAGEVFITGVTFQADGHKSSTAVTTELYDASVVVNGATPNYRRSLRWPLLRHSLCYAHSVHFARSVDALRMPIHNRNACTCHPNGELCATA